MKKSFSCRSPKNYDSNTTDLLAHDLNESEGGKLVFLSSNQHLVVILTVSNFYQYIEECLLHQGSFSTF